MRAADTELFRDKIELSLDGKQVFYLFFGGAVLASMVFVLGVMVGKRVEARSHVDAEAATTAGLDPLAALDKLDANTRSKDLAFRGALSSDEALAGLGAVDARLTPPKIAEVVMVSKDDGKAADVEESKPQPKEAKEAKASVKPREEAHVETKPEPKAAPKAAVAAAEPSEDEQADGPKAAKAKAKKKFTLQLSSFQDESEASAFVSQLKQAGYRPYVRRAEVEGTPWFRVRVGGYPSFDEAVEAKKKFEQDRGIIAYVTRM